MGWDNAGNVNRLRNFSADASAGIKILASAMDEEIDDIVSAISLAWTINGQNTPTTDLSLGGTRLINVGQAQSASDFIRAREVIENVPIYMEDTTTSADRISVSAQFFTSVSAGQAPAGGTRVLVKTASRKTSAVMYLSGFSANVLGQDGRQNVRAMASGGIYDLIFNSSDSVWILQNPSNGSDVRHYKAIPDNSTNNSAVLNAAASSNSANIMFFDQGNWRTEGPINIKGRTKVEGVGLGSQIIFNASASDEACFTGTSTDNVIFHDFLINGNVGSNPRKRGFDFGVSISRIIWDHVHVDTCGIRGIARSSAQYDIIDRCRFDNIDYSTVGTELGIAIEYLGFANSLTIRDTHFLRNDQCIRISQGYGIKLDRCTFEGNGDSGNATGISDQVYITSADTVDIVDCSFEAERTGNGNGVVRLGSCENASLRNCVFYGDVGGTTYSDNFILIDAPSGDTIVDSCKFSETKTTFAIVANNSDGYILRFRNCKFYDGGSEVSSYNSIMSYMTSPSYVELDIPVSATYDPPNLAAGSATVTSVSVVGAVVGDKIFATFTQDIQGVDIRAWISNAGNASVKFKNDSSTAINIAAGALKLFIEKP